jgi:hypothetical protein
MILGTPDNDILYGVNGNNIIYGRDGDDSLYGGNGTNYLYGENGDDFLFVSSGENFLDGGLGNDTLIGGRGSDTLTGGDGADQFWFIHADAVDTVTDFTVTADYWINDSLVFGEAWGLPFRAKGEMDYSNSSDSKDPTVNKIIGVTKTTASTDWADVVSVINNGIDVTQGDGTNDGTYIVVSNETDSRVYFWQGDTDQNNQVDEDELTHFVDLDDFTNISNLTENNFDIIENPLGE